MDAVRYDRVGHVAVLTVEYVLYRRGRVPDGAGRHPRADSPVAEAFGMPIGPIAMRDMSGLDVGMMVRETRKATLPEGERFSSILERLVERGRLGMKSGQGFYRYEGRQKFPDPETTLIIEDAARELGIERPTRRSSSTCSPPWSTKARRNWRTVPRFAPAISMSLGSTDMVSPRTRAVPCSGVRESGSIASTRRPWKQRSATVPAGARASCSSGSHVKVGAGRMPDGRSLFTFLNRLSRR